MTQPSTQELAPDELATAVRVTPREGTPKGVSASILHGVSRFTTEDERGRLHWISPGQVVVYRVCGIQSRTFVFRTGARCAPDGTHIGGVERPVRLLLQTATLRQEQLVRLLLSSLAHQGRDPSSLPDLFYLRLQGVLNRRGPRATTVRALLNHHDDVARA